MNERERKLAALTGLFLGRRYQGITPYESMHQSYANIAGERYGHREQSVRMFHEFTSAFSGGELKIKGATIASTSWTQLVSDAMHKALLDLFYVDPYTVQAEQIVSQFRPLQDYQNNEAYAHAGIDMLTISEGGTYADIAGTPASNGQVYKAVKRGGVINYTLEAFLADNVGAFRAIPRAASHAAARTLFFVALNTFVSNPVTNYDAAALVAAGHLNIATAGIPTDLFSAFARMHAQTDPASGETLFIQPKIFVYFSDPTTGADELAAWNLVKAHWPQLSAPSEEVARIWDTHGIIPVQIPFAPTAFGLLAGNTNFWWLLANPRIYDTVEIGYVGSREPEITLVDDPKQSPMFATDTQSLKVTYSVGGVFLNHRTLVGGIA